MLLFIARGYIPHGRGEIINILREQSSQVVIMHKLGLCETMCSIPKSIDEFVTVEYVIIRIETTDFRLIHKVDLNNRHTETTDSKIKCLF